VSDWIKHTGSDRPSETFAWPFEAKFRNGQTARYPAGAKSRWDQGRDPFDIVAYRITKEPNSP